VGPGRGSIGIYRSALVSMVEGAGLSIQSRSRASLSTWILALADASMNGPEAHRSRSRRLEDRTIHPGVSRDSLGVLMKKLSRKSALLFGGVLAVCAFAVPMASAASWAVIGTHHVLASPDLRFTAGFGGAGFVNSGCADTEFTANVASAANLEITAATLRNCTGIAPSGATNCTSTAVGTNFPWTATARLTTDIQIHGVRVDVTFENQPGNPTACAINGATTLLTGTLTGGSFHPSSVGANRRITLNHAPGLTSHSALTGSTPAFVSGIIRDTTATLNVFD
jgi:hypothetical protein